MTMTSWDDRPSEYEPPALRAQRYERERRAVEEAVKGRGLGCLWFVLTPLLLFVLLLPVMAISIEPEITPVLVLVLAEGAVLGWLFRGHVDATVGHLDSLHGLADRGIIGRPAPRRLYDRIRRRRAAQRDQRRRIEEAIARRTGTQTWEIDDLGPRRSSPPPA